MRSIWRHSSGVSDVIVERWGIPSKWMIAMTKIWGEVNCPEHIPLTFFLVTLRPPLPTFAQTYHPRSPIRNVSIRIYVIYHTDDKLRNTSGLHFLTSFHTLHPHTLAPSSLCPLIPSYPHTLQMLLVQDRGRANYSTVEPSAYHWGGPYPKGRNLYPKARVGHPQDNYTENFGRLVQGKE